MAGVPVLICRPFAPGDRIGLAGRAGTARAIHLRGTVRGRDAGDVVPVLDGLVLSDAVRVARHTAAPALAG